MSFLNDADVSGKNDSNISQEATDKDVTEVRVNIEKEEQDKGKIGLFDYDFSLASPMGSTSSISAFRRDSIDN